MKWFKVEDELPEELFSYGCESVDVLVAACPYGQWEYGVGYCVRATSGVEWVSTLHDNKIYPTHWVYIDQPIN